MAEDDEVVDGSVEIIIPGEVAQQGASATYLEMIQRSLADSWAEDMQIGYRDLKDKIQLVGGYNASLDPAGAERFRELAKHLRIPITLNGQDLIIGIVAGQKILPYVTVLGELAIAVRDPRGLREIVIETKEDASDDGLWLTHTVKLVYHNGAVYTGSDAVLLPSWNRFRDGVQDILLGEVQEDVRKEKAKSKTITHHVFKDAIKSLTEVERSLNRSRGFAARSSATFALRRALQEARARLPIMPMADNDLLNKMSVTTKQQLFTAAMGFGLSYGDILNGLGISDPDMLPDEPTAISEAWEQLVEANGLNRY